MNKHALAVLGACALGTGVMIAFEHGIFFGKLLIGYDATSLVYPWYVNALTAFHHNPFLAFDPYVDGGMVNFNLLANYDPIYFLPLVGGTVPTLFQAQLLVLAHLILVPVCLVALARLYGISGVKLLAVGLLGGVVAFVGFDLKYMETTEAIDGYGWGMLSITAIEYYRIKKRIGYALAAALALDFAFMRFAKGTIYWALFVIPYVAVFWTEFKSRTILRDLAASAAVFFAVAAPCVIEMRHMWMIIESSKFLSVEIEGTRRDILAYFGLYLSPLTPTGQSIYEIPGVLGLLTLLSFVRMNLRERLFFGIALAVLLVYALGTATPIEWIVRHTFPPANAFRRAYEEFYVAFPILLMIVVRYGIAPEDRPLNALWRIGGTVGVLILLGVSAVVSPQALPVNAAASACSVIFLLAYPRVLVTSVLVAAQWILISYIPIAHSIFYPHPAAIVHDEILANRQGIEPYLTPGTVDTTRLYRVMAVGANANFGPYAGVYRFYNLAPDDGTRIPRNLYAVTGVDPLFSNIVAGIRANPGIIGGDSLRSMSVRYYFFPPEEADIASAAQRLHSDLRFAPSPGTWIVLEDPHASAFIAAAQAGSGRTYAVPGRADWDTIAFRFPANAAYVNLGYLYDDWWSGHASDGTPAALTDNHGQLRVSRRGIAGKNVTLRFRNAAFVLALQAQLITYLALVLGAGVALAAYAMRRKPESTSSATITGLSAEGARDASVLPSATPGNDPSNSSAASG